ncbi:MAG: DegT/DnrJ/EryC1/StrS family aminotransferase [Armatimonadetes bacterium]|nr:DegT/DnrJ/EryC1/StrS family aminotransferase [Armatimonadota bacterium]
MIGYPLASSTWDKREIEAVMSVINEGRFTMGPKVREFERRFADYFGSKYAVMVNSGSSANLLAVAALMYRSTNPLSPGDEVIVPAVSWSTTYYPLHQYGLKVKFVDIDLDTLNMDLQEVQKAITPRTRAVFAVNLLGAPNDFAALKKLCEDHDLLLIEDNCESMGAKYAGRYTGTFGVCGTFSTFFSHHICTMEGGMALTDDEELYQIMVSLRAHGWTRELPDRNYVHDKDGNPFHDMYRFVLPGYNLRPLEISGAVGICQLEKLAGFLEARRRNAESFVELFGGLDYVRIQRPLGESSWFAFALVLDGPLSGRREEVVARLSEAGVECRPIVAGNFTKNPVIRYFDHEIQGDLPNANRIDVDGLFIGNHHYDISSELAEVQEELSAVSRQPSAGVGGWGLGVGKGHRS